jgi:hypothetical protein
VSSNNEAQVGHLISARVDLGRLRHIEGGHLADGSKGYSISCDGNMQNFGSCLEKAGDLCGAQGYMVVNQQGDAVPFSAATGGYSASAVAASGGVQAQSGMMVTRTLFVRCK